MNYHGQPVGDGNETTKWTEDYCKVVIPGIGKCELEIADHPTDSRGRFIHRRGACSWNGDYGSVKEEA